jgi:serine/threonine protein kinase
MAHDYYADLGLTEKASDEVIRAAYRALARKYQSDSRRLRIVNAANDVLADHDKKKEYDAKRGRPVGDVVGDYRIIREIAEGGFGKTYHAEHRTAGKPVCIKKAINLTAEDEALLLEEAQIIWDLRHWGIPAIRDLIRFPDNALGLVMSYVPGPTLAQLVTDKYADGLDPEHVAWITERILNILKYLHMHGVVHGDVKPQNVIVQTEMHTVTLVDYGLSEIKPTSKDESKGYTEYFAAPEAIDGKTPIPESDLFGLGMTMIYMLGGDVANIRVPSTTPEPMAKFIKELIRREPLRRPRVWQEDLCETIKQVREEAFGRVASSMKPLVY